MTNDEHALGERMRQERVRLGFTQSKLAAACEVTPDMWSKYERGLHQPKKMVLRAFANLGADEQFLNTGVRSAGNATRPTPEYRRSDVLAAVALLDKMANSTPTEEEERLIAAYRIANPARKKIMLAMADEVLAAA
jgi:transcriptional regulator with XRE-family HTH domain